MLNGAELGEPVPLRQACRAVHDDRRRVDGRSHVFEEVAQDEIVDVAGEPEENDRGGGRFGALGAADERGASVGGREGGRLVLGWWGVGLWRRGVRRRLLVGRWVGWSTVGLVLWRRRRVLLVLRRGDLVTGSRRRRVLVSTRWRCRVVSSLLVVVLRSSCVSALAI